MNEVQQPDTQGGRPLFQRGPHLVGMPGAVGQFHQPLRNGSVRGEQRDKLLVSRENLKGPGRSQLRTRSHHHVTDLTSEAVRSGDDLPMTDLNASNTFSEQDQQHIVQFMVGRLCFYGTREGHGVVDNANGPAIP